MWQKLMQLQFATNPREVLQWMVNQGAGATIEAYGGNIDEGLKAVRDGAMAITKWTNGLRQTLRNAVGHNELFSKMRRAALTDDGALLFVSAGIDVERELTEQGDAFWWGASDFMTIDSPYGAVAKIVRGYDRANHGPVETQFTLTIDGGCGRGGKLLAALLSPGGQVEDMYEA
jgi:serine/threonine protein phosphatase 1